MYLTPLFPCGQRQPWPERAAVSHSLVPFMAKDSYRGREYLYITPFLPCGQGQPQWQRVAVYRSPVSEWLTTAMAGGSSYISLPLWPRTVIVGESSCISLPCFPVAKDSHGRREQLYLTPLYPLGLKTAMVGESSCRQRSICLSWPCWS